MNEINKNNLAVRNTLYARTLGTLEILYNGVPWELPMSVKGKVMQLFMLMTEEVRMLQTRLGLQQHV